MLLNKISAVYPQPLAECKAKSTVVCVHTTVHNCWHQTQYNTEQFSWSSLLSSIQSSMLRNCWTTGYPWNKNSHLPIDSGSVPKHLLVELWWVPISQHMKTTQPSTVLLSTQHCTNSNCWIHQHLDQTSAWISINFCLTLPNTVTV